MIVSLFLSTVLLVTFAGAGDHNECERSVCEVYKFLEIESHGRKKFENQFEMYAIDNNLRTGHKALKKVIEDLGTTMYIEDDMPLLTYLIKYQKLLHDKTEKRFRQMFDDEEIHMDKLIGDLEKELDEKLQKDKGRTSLELKNLIQKIDNMEAVIDSNGMRQFHFVELIINNFTRKIDESEDKISRMITDSENRMAQMMDDLYINMKESSKTDPETLFEVLKSMITEAEMKSSQVTEKSVLNITETPTNVSQIFRSYDCSDILKSGNKKSGVYPIYPRGEEVMVYCDMIADGGGWTVFLKRQKQIIQENFVRNWTDYRNGFGTPPNEYWLGNEFLHQMTSHRNYSMRTDYAGPGRPAKVWGEYFHFHVASESMKYQLSLKGRNAEDTMDISKTGFSFNDEQYFSTMDRDNDKLDRNCAEASGAFWHDSCSWHDPTNTYDEMEFYLWSKVDHRGRYATAVEMKIRPRN